MNWAPLSDSEKSESEKSKIGTLVHPLHPGLGTYPKIFSVSEDGTFENDHL